MKALSADQRRSIALNVNLDSVGGSPDLAALTSGFADLEPYLLRVAEASGIPLRTVRPLMQNSDHANFALAGIPAMRLVAGFDDPSANLRYVLTPADTRDKVREGELAASRCARRPTLSLPPAPRATARPRRGGARCR